MNNVIEKKLSELNRWEWSLWQWHEVTEVVNDERHFVRGYRRTPQETVAAAAEWDVQAEIDREGATTRGPPTLLPFSMACSPPGWNGRRRGGRRKRDPFRSTVSTRSIILTSLIMPASKSTTAARHRARAYSSPSAT